VVIAGCILAGLFGLIMTEVMHRTMAAMIGAAACMIVLAVQNRPPSLSKVVGWMDHGTLGLLWGMMLIVGITMRTGVFEWTGVLACKLSKGDKTKLLLLLCAVTGVLSAFLDNVTTILLIAPVTCKLCKLVNIDPRPFLICETFFSNLFGTSTMIGDPPNIIIGLTPPTLSCVFLASGFPSLASVLCAAPGHKDICDHKDTCNSSTWLSDPPCAAYAQAHVLTGTPA
jgi:Na+/H+ antiporter NhaD/arsenite permease-like protein